MKLATIVAAALVVAVLTTAAALGSAGTKAGGLPTIDVTSDGNSISVTGTLESGAVDVHTVATGASGTPIFIRLNDGVTADQVIAFLQSKKANDPNNIEPYGSIVFDWEYGPGTSDVQTILQPGNYLAVDGTVNSPTKWPHTTFSISANSSPASLPAADAWQKSVEYKFRGSKTLHVGQVIRTSNAGWLVHMMIGFEVKSPAAGRKLMRRFRTLGSNGFDPDLLKGGDFSFFGPVSHGAVQQFVLEYQQTGWYVEVCFMQTQDGREHARLGMERLIHVV